MIGLASLWLPILVAAVLVFVASALLHMVLRHHNSDYDKLPDEDASMDALRRENIPPGSYMFPNCSDPGAMKRPEVQQKLKQGPLGMLVLRPGGSMNMAPMLLQWFIYVLLLSVLIGYLTSRTLSAGAAYLQVFRVAGCGAFLAYAGGQCIESIWYWRKWSATIKNIVDGLIYALVTGGAFGWLWPR